MNTLPGVAIKRLPPPTLGSLGAADLRVVARGEFRPRGGRYDVRPLKKRPLRALRGGGDGLVAAYAIRDGCVEITILAGPEAGSEADVAWAMAAARDIAAVDDDPSEFLAMAGQHPLVEQLAQRFDCRIARSPTVFESFARAVIEQLVTTQEASASIRRLFALAGEEIVGTVLRAPPLPRAVLAVPPWKLHAIGIGARRSRTLREGARRGAALERLRDVEPAVAAVKLESLPGVGPWTANLVARTALGWTDAVPVRDFHAHYVISEALTGEQGDDAAMLEALAPFRPHRARVVALITSAQMGAALPGFGGRQRPLPRVDPHRREPWKY
jgi:3-methyladenine DNA glycosylase/8-oxoguanine DNA glycosylase